MQDVKITVSGVVLDVDGPVIGASVVEKGNPGNGVATDVDGRYTELVWYLGTDFAFYGDLAGNTTTRQSRNYTRDKRADVYASVRDDLAEAATLLPNVEDARDGQVNKQVAQHLLAEIYISLGENQKPAVLLLR